MKFLCERDVLKDALAHVVNRAKGGLTIPILTHVLIEAAKAEITLTGHDLDSCSRISIAAEVSSAGTVAVPAERLNRLVQGLPTGSQISFDADEKQGKVRAGRSIYTLPLLPATDFPDLLAPRDGVALTVTAERLRRMFAPTADCASDDKARLYLHGVFVHAKNDVLTTCGTDGFRLIEISTDQEFEIDKGVTVPESACREFIKMTAEEAVEIEIAPNIISLKSGRRYFASKLLDSEFPDYARVVPAQHPVGFTFETAELDGALARIESVVDPETKVQPVVTLEWEDKPDSIKIGMQTLVGHGLEQVDCTAGDQAKEGSIQFRVKVMRAMLASIDSERVTFFIVGPNDPVRVLDPDASDLLGVLMPFGKGA